MLQDPCRPGRPFPPLMLRQDKGWSSFSEGSAGGSLALLISAAIGTGALALSACEGEVWVGATPRALVNL